MQIDLAKCKSHLKQYERQVTPSTDLQQVTEKSFQQNHKLMEKAAEQSKKLKEQVVENKRMAERMKELERLFLNAKTKLDQTEARAGRLAKEVAQLKEKYENLNVLNQYYRTMKIKAIQLMSELTKPSQEKRTLNLRFMELDDSQVPMLVELLKQCPYAETLDLEGNFLSDSGVKVLCDYLKTLQCRVAFLNLNWNKVDLEGAWALVEAIMTRDFELENNITKTFADQPLRFARISLSYNKLASHTALLKKVMDYLKTTQRDALVELKITKKALLRAAAKTVGQAFRAVNATFAELAEIKTLTAVLDRIQIEHNDYSATELESKKLEERATAVTDFHTQLQRLQSLQEASEKASLFASVLHNDEKDLRRKHYAERMFKPKQTLSANELAGSLTKELNIPLLLAKRPAFPLTFIEKTIAAGLDVNAVDKKLDETLLMYAARTGNIKMAQLVAEKGAVVDQTNVMFR